MPTVYELTRLQVTTALAADYASDRQDDPDVTLETTWGARDRWSRTWNSGDNFDSLGAGIVRIPMTASLNGIGPARLLYLWIEPSTQAAATGVQISTDEALTFPLGLWLRAVSATQRGVFFVRGLAVTLASGAGTQNIVLRNATGTDVTVHAVYAGDAA